MRKHPTPILIAFDFDGTLYPIRPYDSEQRMMFKATRNAGTLKRRLAKRAVLKDMKGMMHGGEFTYNYIRFTRDMPASLLDEVVEDLCTLVSDDVLLPLQELKDMGAELCIISCGTENLAERYLGRMNAREIFGNIIGKRFETTQGRLSSVQVTISSPADKVQALRHEAEKLRERTGTAPLTIAVGDGPTDIPMLQSADLGIIIDWEKGRDTSDVKNGFTYVGSIKEVCDIVKRWVQTQSCEI